MMDESTTTRRLYNVRDAVMAEIAYLEENDPGAVRERCLWGAWQLLNIACEDAQDQENGGVPQ